MLWHTAFNRFPNAAAATRRLSIKTWSVVIKINNAYINVEARSVPVDDLGGVERRVGRYDGDPVIQAIIDVQRTDGEYGGALAGNFWLKCKQRVSGRRRRVAIWNNSTFIIEWIKTRSSATAEKQRVSWACLSRLANWSCNAQNTAESPNYLNSHRNTETILIAVNCLLT